MSAVLTESKLLPWRRRPGGWGRGRTLAAAACATAAMVAAAMAFRIPIGVALLVAACYAPVALADLRLGVALWLPILFFEAIPEFNLAAKAGGLLVLAAWVLRARNGQVRAFVARHAARLSVLVLLLLWITMSMTWAVDRRHVSADLWHWYAVALVFLVVATTCRTVRAIRLVCAAFIVGGVASVLVGFATHSMTASPGSERLTGPAGDPNFLAAWVLSGAIIALGLYVGVASPTRRRLLALATAVLVTGLAATLSRGAFVAAAAAVPIAFVVLPRQRLRIVAIVTVVTLAASAWLTASPSALERLTVSDRGDGRFDLWTVAWRVAEDHPIVGAGLNNFYFVQSRYLAEVGPLPGAVMMAGRGRPQEVHNMYLQMLAETGLIGFVLFVTFIGGCLYAAVLAGRRFEATGDHAGAMLAYAIALGIFTMLVAGFFLSSAVDKRLWVLLALGPAILDAAVRQTAGRVR